MNIFKALSKQFNEITPSMLNDISKCPDMFDFATKPEEGILSLSNFVKYDHDDTNINMEIGDPKSDDLYCPPSLLRISDNTICLLLNMRFTISSDIITNKQTNNKFIRFIIRCKDKVISTKIYNDVRNSFINIIKKIICENQTCDRINDLIKLMFIGIHQHRFSLKKRMFNVEINGVVFKYTINRNGACTTFLIDDIPQEDGSFRNVLYEIITTDLIGFKKGKSAMFS